MQSYFITLYPTPQYFIAYRGIFLQEDESMKPLKNKVSITLDNDIIQKIKELAENDDRSFSQYINMVLKDYLDNIDDSKK